MDSINSNTIYFAKTNPNAIIPSKNDEDMGYDIYACMDTPFLRIDPHQTVMIPTGICSAFSSDYGFIIKERGSTGTKGMAIRCGVIDSGFRGEWKIVITNVNNKPLVITQYPDAPLSEDCVVYPANKAIAQATIVHVPKVDIKELAYEELISIASERGDGMLGSTNK